MILEKVFRFENGRVLAGFFRFLPFFVPSARFSSPFLPFFVHFPLFRRIFRP